MHSSVNNEVVQTFQGADDVIKKYNLALEHNSLTQKGWERLLAQSDDGLKAYLTSIKGAKASMDAYTFSLQGSVTGFKKVTNAIRQYNTITDPKEQEAFATAVGITNKKLGSYLTGLNGSTASMTGYGISLVGATLKTVGLTAATAALNAVMTMGISVIVTGLISVFTAWTNKSEEITKKAQEAADKISSISDNLKSNIETVEKAKKRYAELAQEVENLGKANQNQGTLNNEEYEEFLDLSNQLAEVFPSLSQNYDENGNAILNLSGNIDTIVSSLDSLIEKEKEVANRQIMEEFPGVFTGYMQGLSEAEKEAEKKKKEFDELNDIYQQLSKGESTTRAFDSNGNNIFNDENDNERIIKLQEYKQILEELGIAYKEIQIPNEFGSPIGTTIETIGNIDDAIFSNNSEFITRLNDSRKEWQYAQEELERQKSSITSGLNTWLETEWYLYGKIKDIGLQSAVQEMLFNFDFSKLPENIDGNNWEEVSEYLRHNILFEMTNLQDDPKILKAFTEIFSNAELTPDERANYFKQIIEDFGEDSAIAISLQPKIDENETLQKQYDAAISRFDTRDKETLVQFFKDNSINDSSEIDYFNEVTESAKSATDAIKMYNEEKQNRDKAPSFSDVFNSSDFAESKNALLELAKSGELSPSVLSSTEEYATLLSQTGLSADEAAKEILNLLDTTDKLAAASSEIQKLQAAYDDFQENGFVLAETLSSLPDVFKELNGFDSFEEIVRDPTNGAEKIQDAFNNIVMEYLSSQQTMADLSESNMQSYIANLKAMGITNAEEIVESFFPNIITSSTQEIYDAYLNYLQSKDAADLEYFNSLVSKNSTLAQALGSAYQSDYNNWIELLGKKAEAYNNFVNAIHISQIDLGSSSSVLSKEEAALNAAKQVVDNAKKYGIKPLFNNPLLQTTNSNAKYTQTEVDTAQKYIDSVKNANQAEAHLSMGLSTIPANLRKPLNLSGSGSDTDYAKESLETFNFIEIAITRIEDAIEKLKTKAEETFRSFTARGRAYAKSIAKIKNEISLQEKARDEYTARANSYGLDEAWAAQVRNGSINIADIADDGLKEQINNYQEW